MAKCSRCKSPSNLFVWFVPDPYNDYPLHPEIICSTCPPPPTELCKDMKQAYDPNVHDKIFGFKNYSVPLSRLYHGPNDVHGLCFECNGDINMTKGYGHCYVPQSYWHGTTRTSVAYCQSCFTRRCQNHIDVVQMKELENLVSYWEKTINGQLLVQKK